MQMSKTIDIITKILTNILTALYEPFGFSLLLSLLATFFYLYAYEPIHAGKGWKSDMVSEFQRERVLPEAVLTGYCDIDDPV